MDRYKSFAELCEDAVAGRDFQIRSLSRPGQIAVIAPHGGGIEPGTSEIAEAVAGATFSFYAFEGIRPNNNGDLHITSTRFREPQCASLLAVSPMVLTIHGEDSAVEAVFVGGLATDAAARITKSLKAAGFAVERHSNPGLQGENPANICNQGQRREGVQLELSSGLRSTFFEGLARRRRRARTAEFDSFVKALRQPLEHL
ncbi:MAG: poly-gamma-glutamate hydrolase family protein [Vicinamibacterales bacterium]